MATRDLTTRFLRCRSSAGTKRPREASQSGAALLGGGAADDSGWAAGALTGMHPQYVDLMDDVNADIAGIKARSKWAWCGAHVKHTDLPLPPRHLQSAS